MNDITDTTVFCGNWPFRCLSRRTPGQIRELLESRGVREAWICSVESILYPEPMEGNEPLFEQIAEDDFFVPVAIIDVTHATWRRDAQTCLDRWGARAFKLFPNYHQYELRDPRVSQLVDLATEANVPISIQMRMLDERAHHLLMKVPFVPPEDIVGLAQRHPAARLLVCGAHKRNIEDLSKAPNIWADTSFTEGGQALRGAAEGIGGQRVVFGSHTPIFYLDAGLAKLDVEKVDVSPEVVDRVRRTNAAELLTGAPIAEEKSKT